MPVVLAKRARLPLATLCVPCVLLKRDFTPIALFTPPVVFWLSARSPNAEFHPPVVTFCNAPAPSAVLPWPSAVAGTSPRAFLRNVARGESEAGALGTAKKKASVSKLAVVRNRLVILNGIFVFIIYLSGFKYGSEKAIGRNRLP